VLDDLGLIAGPGRVGRTKGSDPVAGRSAQAPPHRTADRSRAAERDPRQSLVPQAVDAV